MQLLTKLITRIKSKKESKKRKYDLTYLSSLIIKDHLKKDTPIKLENQQKKVKDNLGKGN